MKLPIYILAGGQSSRFGSDKALALRSGRPQLLWLADRIRPIAAAVTVIGRENDHFATLGLRTIADRAAGLGPMSGLDAAIADLAGMHQSDSWFALISCDLTAFEARWIESLDAKRENGRLAVAFRHDRWEPLIALYNVAIKDEVDRRMERNELSLWRLLESVEATAVPIPTDWPTIAQFNTPQDLEAATRLPNGAPGGANRR